MQKERPIIFRSEGVRAILDGRKSQTRRIIKPQPNEGGFQFVNGSHWGVNEPNFIRKRCPYGVVGNRLWCKEKHALGGNGVFFPDSCDGTVHIAWTSARFMKKIYARIWLEITGIRVERVQEITPRDSICEGAKPTVDPFVNTTDRSVIKRFQVLWNSIHGKGAWERNDWVWVIEFKKVG